MTQGSYPSLYSAKTRPPESEVQYKPQATLEDIELSFRNQKPICGIVISADPEKEECKVALSNLITATLPFDECIVQNFIDMLFINERGEKKLGNYTQSLIGHQVMVTITKLTTDCIEVSRKPSLNQAFEEILQECKNNDATFLCTVLSYSSKAVFVDMGGGIVGLIPIGELSFVEYFNLSKWIKIGEKFYAKIENYNEDGHFTLSRKAYYSRFCVPKNYTKDSYMQVTISRPVAQNDGYFVELPGRMVGLMDSTRKYKEGDTAIAVITKTMCDPTFRCGFRIHLTEASTVAS